MLTRPAVTVSREASNRHLFCSYPTARSGGYGIITRMPGRATEWCRLVSTVVLLGPVLYWTIPVGGDAYVFLALVLAAPLAGAVLFANSLYCLIRYRSAPAFRASLAFMLLSTAGIFEAWYFLPRFGM
jgi:hypothetical protein